MIDSHRVTSDSLFERGSSAYRRVIVCMVLGSVVTFAVLYAPQPLMDVFSKQYGVSPATASLSISLSTIAIAVSLLFVPLVARTVDRKTLMVGSLFTTSLLACLSALCPTFSSFLLVRLLEGISVSGFPTIAVAYLNEETASSSIGGTMGAYVGGTAVGGFMGRVAIGPITDLWSWRMAFLVLGLICLLCSLWFWAWLPKPAHTVAQKIGASEGPWYQPYVDGLSPRRMIPMYLMGFTIMGAYILLFNYVGYPLTEPPYRLSQTDLSLLFVVNLIGIWSSMLFGGLADKFSRSRLITAACFLYAIGAFLTLLPGLWVKIIGIAVFAFGFFGTQTTASGWVGVAAPAGQKATGTALYQLCYYIGSSVVGWFGGLIWVHFGWIGIVMSIWGFVLLCYLLMRLANRLARRATPLSPTSR